MAETMSAEARTVGLPGLRGKNVLVTGGSSGIGQAIAVRCAEDGANVAINYLRTPDEAHDTEEQVHACTARVARMGVRDVLVGGDVSSEEDVVRMVGEAADGLGGLDILVNNAGIVRDRTVKKMALGEWHSVLDTNLVLPLGVDRCRVIFDFYFGPNFSDDRARQSIAVSDRIQDEDVAICEAVQRGLHSQAYRAGRLSVRREAGEHLFHRLLARDLKGALA